MAFGRRSVMRPSGFWQALIMTTLLLRIRFVTASLENASFLSSMRPASTPVVSPPWMLLLMNTGTRRSPPFLSIARAAVGFSVWRRMNLSQRCLAAGEAHFFWIVTSHSGCPPAEVANCLTLTRALCLSIRVRIAPSSE